eukprot:Rmarinus@m.4405
MRMRVGMVLCCVRALCACVMPASTAVTAPLLVTRVLRMRLLRLGVLLLQTAFAMKALWAEPICALIRPRAYKMRMRVGMVLCCVRGLCACVMPASTAVTVPLLVICVLRMRLLRLGVLLLQTAFAMKALWAAPIYALS